jgi:hypothetical protein
MQRRAQELSPRGSADFVATGIWNWLNCYHDITFYIEVQVRKERSCQLKREARSEKRGARSCQLAKRAGVPGQQFASRGREGVAPSPHPPPSPRTGCLVVGRGVSSAPRRTTLLSLKAIFGLPFTEAVGEDPTFNRA